MKISKQQHITKDGIIKNNPQKYNLDKIRKEFNKLVDTEIESQNDLLNEVSMWNGPTEDFAEDQPDPYIVAKKQIEEKYPGIKAAQFFPNSWTPKGSGY